MLSETVSIAVDSRSVCFEASLAVAPIVPIRSSSAPDSQYEPASQRGSKSYSAPDSLARHNRLPKINVPEGLVGA